MIRSNPKGRCYGLFGDNVDIGPVFGGEPGISQKESCIYVKGRKTRQSAQKKFKKYSVHRGEEATNQSI
jgi:hypothetical protein